MKQLRKTFEAAGKVKMKELQFFNPILSKEALRQEAMMIADMMDTVFRVGRGAKLEEDVTRTQAMNDMAGILVNGNKTVADLSETIDASYNFWNEKN